jgi:hypothetical protein
MARAVLENSQYGGGGVSIITLAAQLIFCPAHVPTHVQPLKEPEMQPNDTASNDPSAVPTVTVPTSLVARAATTLANLIAVADQLASEGADAVTSVHEVQAIARNAASASTRETVALLRSALAPK